MLDNYEYGDNDLVYHYSVLDARMMTEVLGLIEYINQIDMLIQPYFLALKSELEHISSDKYVDLVNKVISSEDMERMGGYVHSLDDFLYDKLYNIEYQLNVCDIKYNEVSKTQSEWLMERYVEALQYIKNKIISINAMNTFANDLTYYYRYGD